MLQGQLSDQVYRLLSSKSITEKEKRQRLKLEQDILAKLEATKCSKERPDRSHADHADRAHDDAEAPRDSTQDEPAEAEATHVPDTQSEELRARLQELEDTLAAVKQQREDDLVRSRKAAELALTAKVTAEDGLRLTTMEVRRVRWRDVACRGVAWCGKKSLCEAGVAWHA